MRVLVAVNNHDKDQQVLGWIGLCRTLGWDCQVATNGVTTEFPGARTVHYRNRGAEETCLGVWGWMDAIERVDPTGYDLVVSVHAKTQLERASAVPSLLGPLIDGTADVCLVGDPNPTVVGPCADAAECLFLMGFTADGWRRMREAWDAGPTEEQWRTSEREPSGWDPWTMHGEIRMGWAIRRAGLRVHRWTGRLEVVGHEIRVRDLDGTGVTLLGLEDGELRREHGDPMAEFRR